MRIKAKFESKCPECGYRIGQGLLVLWEPGQKAKHLHCDGGAPVKEFVEGKQYVWLNPKWGEMVVKVWGVDEEEKEMFVQLEPSVMAQAGGSSTRVNITNEIKKQFREKTF